MSQTARNLKTIFETCRTEALRYLSEAEINGRPEAVRCFRALALARRIHAEKIEPLLTDVPQNTAPETVSIAEAAMTAAREGERVAESVLRQIMLAEKSHTVIGGCAGASPESFHACRICGFISRKTIPERCPVCRAVAEQFQTIE